MGLHSIVAELVPTIAPVPYESIFRSLKMAERLSDVPPSLLLATDPCNALQRAVSVAALPLPIGRQRQRMSDQQGSSRMTLTTALVSPG
jgi:hypothetical protein